MKNLIRETLENRFNVDNYIKFVKNFFNEINIESKEIIVPNEFKSHINKFTFLGDYQDVQNKNIDVFAVELIGDTKVERARAFQRNLVVKFLKSNQKDASLVAFYSQDKPDWRLSFVKLDYKLTERGVRVEAGTPPKRYSFLVGKTEPSHTAKRQLLPILQEQKVNPLISEIEDCFSVEKVTKEFYISILRCFIKLVGGEALVGSRRESHRGILKLPSTIDHKKKQEFATRLLGRIIFCWFLKKKKSTQDRFLIPEDLISRQSVDKFPNYYHAVLEPLFFQQLNTPLNLRVGKYKDSDIPFLNGGLFQPHIDDFYQVNRVTELSIYVNTLIIPDDWFKELFEVLETYNFTIDESTSIDVDLSIDPEILGRIFENLLAEINPETGETARKSTGSFYTPRSIVEYMVDGALKHYLEDKTGIDLERLSTLLSYDENVPKLIKKEEVAIIDALDKLKIIDPACGSGAFPMGILQKAVLILQKVDPHCKMWLEKQISRIGDTYLRQVLGEKLENENLDYVRKLGIVQNTVHGVDIQPMAVEIAKLRFFLSLIVDVEIEDNKENRGIRPLPNLEFKFVCANSLIELKEPSQAGFFQDQFFSELERLTKDYFSVSKPQDKESLKEQIEELIRIKLKDNFSKVISLTKATITDSSFDELVKQKHSEQIRTLSYEAGLWESYLNIFKDEPVGFFNLKYFFPEVKDGFDIAIANPPYVSVKEIPSSDKVIFSKLLETAKGRFNLFTLFLEKAHKLLKQEGTLIFILPEGLFSNVEYRYIREYLLRNSTLLFINMFSKRVFEASVDTAIIALRKNTPKSNNEFPVFRDLHERTLELCQSDFIEMPFFIFTVKLNEKNAKIFKKSHINNDYLENILEIQQGIIYSGQSKSTIFSNTCVDGRYKKVLDGRDVLKWKINWTEKKENKYIQYTKKLHRPREERLFLANEKIFIVRRSTKIIAAYDNEQYYALNTAYSCLLKNNSYKLKYILAILNSKLINFLYQIMFFGWQVTIPALNFIPIKNTSSQKDFVEAIDKILTLTKSNDYLSNSAKQEKVMEYERQIDQMVYKLYGLTCDEIKIVEGN